jgi:hypothetical protein
MKAKDFLLVGSGLAIGYLIFKKDLFKKKTNAIAEVKTGTEQILNGAGSVVGGAIDTVSGAVKDVLPTGGTRTSVQDVCEKKWTEYAQTIRPASQEALDKMKDKFMTSCLSGK